MSKSFRLPDLGEGIHEGEVLAVLVSVGDKVQEEDPILEIETDKAAVEIPSPYSGSILEIHVQPGEVVKVGDKFGIRIESMLLPPERFDRSTPPSAPPPIARPGRSSPPITSRWRSRNAQYSGVIGQVLFGWNAHVAQ